MQFFFVINRDKPHAEETADRALQLLERAGAVCTATGKNALSSSQDLKDSDMIIAVGGDGTILSAAQFAVRFDKPILGLHAGRLGFLSGARGEELGSLLRLLRGSYVEHRRMLLTVRVGEKSRTAVNDLLITKPALGSLIDVSVQESGRDVIDYRADSVLFSTPTGSTAYALSSGGPVADPALSFISMAPICSHSLVSRTYLFSDSAKLTAKLGEDCRGHLVIDGEPCFQLPPGQEVHIRRSERTLRLVCLQDQPFYEVVREKFLPQG